MSSRLLGVVVLSSVMVAASGCALGGQSKPARAQEAALELNLNARFGRMELAAERVAPAARDAFFDRRKQWGGNIRVADYELSGLRMAKSESDAEAFVKVAWYRVNEGDLRVTTLKQKWHDFKGDWKLTEESRLDGEVGLLGEPPPAATTNASAPRRTQFPTVRLGSGDTVGDIPPALQLAPPSPDRPLTTPADPSPSAPANLR